MRILAIESSCDETAAAVIENGTNVLSSVVASSAKLHEKFGGILPELAAREQLHYIIPVIMQSLHEAFPQLTTHNTQLFAIDAIAVTQGPGLIGSLLIGVESAKTIAAITGKPLIPVNHVHAHIYANLIRHSRVGGNPSSTSDVLRSSTETPTMDPGLRSPRWSSVEAGRDDIEFPAIALVVSGGHTELFLMESERKLKWLSGTIDDAAGEAFDKTARLLGFANRGGAAIEEAAKQKSVVSSQLSVKLPRPLLHEDNLNFSFSGLKTAVVREWEKHPKDSRLSTHDSRLVSAFAYEIQEAVTDVLVAKTLRAAEQYNAQSILVAGGVAANKRLREKFASQQTSDNRQLTTLFPPIELCTDNAVTIGSCAFFLGKEMPWKDVTAIPDLSVEIPR